MAEDSIHRLLEIMALLRHPDDGCPWDVEQTFATIAPHTIEEAYEVVDAIERGDMAALVDELGDLLLQVVFHARMAEEAGHFAFEDVAAAICAKLVRRHPHVFGDAVVDGAAGQTQAWEAQKARERKAQADDAEAHGALDGVIAALPALTRAHKLQNRAARVGFDWDAAKGVLDKIKEETDELSTAIEADDADAVEDELGDLLFTAVNLSRKLGHEPESALRRANAKFERRFRRMEALLERPIEDADMDEMESAWDRAKREDAS